MLVFGIRDKRTKERLLREANLTLQTALDICRAAEASRLQIQAMAKDPPQVEVHSMQTTQQAEGTVSPAVSKRQTGKGNSRCRYCGGTHPPRQCPAYGRTCGHCHKPNHFARVCQQKHGTAKAVHAMKDLSEEEEEQADVKHSSYLRFLLEAWRILWNGQKY
jgi:hypothetical protein